MNMDRVMYWFTFLIVTSLTYDVIVSLQCPTSSDAWNRASLALQCKLPNFYHCLKDEKDVITEQCLAKVWIEGGMCPVYSSLMSKIDVIECSAPSCPQSTYWSNSVFLYPVCFETKTETAKTTAHSTEQSRPTTYYMKPLNDYPQRKVQEMENDGNKDSGEGKDSSNATIYMALGICAILVLILVVILGALLVRRKKWCKSSDHTMQENALEKSALKVENLGMTSCSHDNCEDGGSPNRQQTAHLLGKNDDKTTLGKCSLQENKDLNIPAKTSCNPNKKSLDALTEKSNQPKTRNIPEESMKFAKESTSSAKKSCQVYIASGPKLKEEPEPRFPPQILILKTNNPVEITQINNQAQETFGRKYMVSRNISYLKEHEKEQPALSLLMDFDLNKSSVEEVLKKLLEVVSQVETRVAFVVTVPLMTWFLNGDNLERIAKGGDMIVCKKNFV